MKYTFTVKDADGNIVGQNTVGDSSIMALIAKALNKGHQITVHSNRFEKASRKPEIAG